MDEAFMSGAGKKLTSELRALGIPGDEIDVIGKFISEMSGDPGIEAIYLYGSYARFRPKPYSDIDIAVITGSITPPREIKEKIGSFSSKTCDIQVFSDLPLPVQMQVIAQGIPLMVKHPDVVRRLVNSVSLSYMDHEPMRDRFRRRILET